ncbi:MAG: 3-hydroxyacyl-CoA dehydrogenase family protein [Firmicutes bacterium]|nr:3-hydroxyacyl-CoA dehydrogenase family protein [Bacillota bacterium]
MVDKLLVVGSGTMGAGIAQVAVENGIGVLLYDTSQDQLDKARKTIEGFIQKKVEKGKLSAEDKDAIMGRLELIGDLSEAAHADFVIEAIVELFAVKTELFKQLDGILSPEAVIASNTSSLSITEMAESLKDPSRFIGMHFFSPVPLMRLVEVVKGEKTSEATLEKALELSKALGKTGISVKDVPGFIVNRFLGHLYKEAIMMIQEGVATAYAIDTALKLGANHPMGPCEIMDMAGVDIVYNAYKEKYEKTGLDEDRMPPLLEQMMREGRLGRKTGEGFYRYDK